MRIVSPPFVTVRKHGAGTRYANFFDDGSDSSYATHFVIHVDVTELSGTRPVTKYKRLVSGELHFLEFVKRHREVGRNTECNKFLLYCVIDKLNSGFLILKE